MSSTPSWNNRINLPRLKHAIHWRARYYNDVARFHIWLSLLRLRLELRWLLPLRWRAHGLPHPLVVSLTSYPPRFSVLPLTLRSLLRQRVKADHLILWIARSDSLELPQNVLNLQRHGLEIRITEFDVKAYKKILPSLDEFPEAFIATADDDVYYRSTWLEELVNGVDLSGRVVTCHWANEIITGPDGRYRPYGEWIQNTAIRGAAPDLFPVGVGGVLYPPGVLAHQPEDRAAGLSLCPSADDVWLYWIGRRNGASYKTVGLRRIMDEWPGSQKLALWRSNRHLEDEETEYDWQIRKLGAKYGYPATMHRGHPRSGFAHAVVETR
jgi:hypothetical protein